MQSKESELTLKDQYIGLAVVEKSSSNKIKIMQSNDVRLLHLTNGSCRYDCICNPPLLEREVWLHCICSNTNPKGHFLNVTAYVRKRNIM